jgi:tetratricopeptide (TPR) repeat protein
MGKGAQLAVVCISGLATVASGAAVVYATRNGDPIAGPCAVAATALGLITLACVGVWFRRAFLPALFVFFLAVFAWKGFKEAGPGRIDDYDWMVPALLVAAVIVGIVVGRFKDRVERHAARLLKAGNASQAVTYLEEQLQAKGLTVGGWSVLSLAYGELEKWPEALNAVEEAMVRGGGRNPVLLNNKGIYLWKSGRAEAALPLVEEAARRNPNTWLLACNLGLVLAELGRRAEAEAQLRRAERLATSRVILEPGRITIGGNGQVREQELERLRQKIAELPADTRFTGDPDPANT